MKKLLLNFLLLCSVSTFAQIFTRSIQDVSNQFKHSIVLKGNQSFVFSDHNFYHLDNWGNTIATGRFNQNISAPYHQITDVELLPNGNFLLTGNYGVFCTDVFGETGVFFAEYSDDFTEVSYHAEVDSTATAKVLRAYGETYLMQGDTLVSLDQSFNKTTTTYPIPLNNIYNLKNIFLIDATHVLITENTSGITHSIVDLSTGSTTSIGNASQQFFNINDSLMGAYDATSIKTYNKINYSMEDSINLMSFSVIPQKVSVSQNILMLEDDSAYVMLRASDLSLLEASVLETPLKSNIFRSFTSDGIYYAVGSTVGTGQLHVEFRGLFQPPAVIAEDVSLTATYHNHVINSYDSLIDLMSATVTWKITVKNTGSVFLDSIKLWHNTQDPFGACDAGVIYDFPNANLAVGDTFSFMLSVDKKEIFNGSSFPVSMELKATVGNSNIIKSQAALSGMYTIQNIGLDEAFTKTALVLYPNPTSGMLSVKGWKHQGALTYSIVNVNGEEVLKGQLSDYLHIDVSGISTGVYFLKLNDASTVISKKIVKF